MMRGSLLLLFLFFFIFFLSSCHAIKTQVSVVAEKPKDAPSFVISGNTFLKDGKPFRILSGSYHYFRVHPSAWQDRLQKALACGLNAVQTYIPWNVHNPEEGIYNFDGLADVVSFIKLAQKVGLLVVLRVGPYACGEWEFGGIPYWIIRNNPNVMLRSADPYYFSYVEKWYSVLLPMIKPLLYSNGGNVILTQIENEYGSYGYDKVYLSSLRDLHIKYFGQNAVIIHSTDGGWTAAFDATHVDGVFQTVDFGPGSDVADNFKYMQTWNNGGPYMNSEYYSGWLTHWGDAHMANANATVVAEDLASILAYQNASVNVYMFQGGTNWGFMNGANSNSPTDFEPSVTSYDYNAPMDEAGDPTPKYFTMCDVFRKYSPNAPPMPPPTPSPKGNYGVVTMTGQAFLFDNLNEPFTKGINVASTYSFERLGLDYGFVLYRTTIQNAAGNELSFQPKDRAWVFLNGTYVGVLMRGQNTSITLPAGSKLDILVENMGRVNYGPYLNDPKGIPGGVTWLGQLVFDWTAYPMSFKDLSKIKYNNVSSLSGPSFYRGTFTIMPGEQLDTFLVPNKFSKGNVFLNGWNLGRYWWVGPQLSLYVNSAYLKTGINEIVVFETETITSALPPTVTLQETPIFT